MHLYKLIFCYILGLAAVSSEALAQTSPDNQQNLTRERMRDMRLDERESTDSLAIPLDSSELEQDEEHESLEKQEKEYQSQKR